MNACRKTQSLLFEKADGRLAAEVRAEMDAHLAICPHCKQTFASWTSALPRLRSLAPDEISPDISEVRLRRMESEIVRDLHSTAQPRARRTFVFALAAGLVLAIGVGVFWARPATSQPFARLQTLWGQVTLSGVAMSKGAVLGPGMVLDIAAEGEAALWSAGVRRCAWWGQGGSCSTAVRKRRAFASTVAASSYKWPIANRTRVSTSPPRTAGWK